MLIDYIQLPLYVSIQKNSRLPNNGLAFTPTTFPITYFMYCTWASCVVFFILTIFVGTTPKKVVN
ncbi:hypothetical protein HZS_4556 [Henneguya salminicola]|nr:hypothetical protein HZS_4556 [Henneguya salminicola]